MVIVINCFKIALITSVAVMVSESDLQRSDLGSFPWSGGYELAFQFFLRVLMKE